MHINKKELLDYISKHYLTLDDFLIDAHISTEEFDKIMSDNEVDLLTAYRIYQVLKKSNVEFFFDEIVSFRK